MQSKYRIRGSMWKRPFKYGISEYGDNDFARLEEMRGELCDFIGAFETEFKKSRKAILRSQALYNFLNETAQIPRKIEEAAFEAEEAGAGAFAPGAFAGLGRDCFRARSDCQCNRGRKPFDEDFF